MVGNSASRTPCPADGDHIRAWCRHGWPEPRPAGARSRRWRPHARHRIGRASPASGRHVRRIRRRPACICPAHIAPVSRCRGTGAGQRVIHQADDADAVPGPNSSSSASRVSEQTSARRCSKWLMHGRRVAQHAAASSCPARGRICRNPDPARRWGSSPRASHQRPW